MLMNLLSPTDSQHGLYHCIFQAIKGAVAAESVAYVFRVTHKLTGPPGVVWVSLVFCMDFQGSTAWCGVVTLNQEHCLCLCSRRDL